MGDLVEIVDLCRIGVRLCAGADQCRHGGIGMSPIIPWCSRDRLSHGRRCLGQPNGRTSAGRITPSACSPGRALSTPPPQSLVCPRLAAFRGHTRTPDEGQCRMRRRLQPRMLGQRRYVDRERNIDALLPHRGTVPGFIGVQVLETSCCNGHRLRCSQAAFWRRHAAYPLGHACWRANPDTRAPGGAHGHRGCQLPDSYPASAGLAVLANAGRVPR